MNDVRLVARWDGWCDPCETERPLLLTESGERGLRAWLHGVGPEDRALVLTCAVCGEWQAIDPDEQDVDHEPAIDLVLSPTGLHRFGVRQIVVSRSATPAAVSPITLRPLGTRQVVLNLSAFSPYPASSVPLPRPPAAGTRQDSAAAASGNETMDLLAEGFDLISLAS